MGEEQTVGRHLMKKNIVVRVRFRSRCRFCVVVKGRVRLYLIESESRGS